MNASNPIAATLFSRTTMMWVRNSKNAGIFMQTDFTKMTDASLWGPKGPQECLLRLMLTPSGGLNQSQWNKFVSHGNDKPGGPSGGFNLNRDSNRDGWFQNHSMIQAPACPGGYSPNPFNISLPEC